MTKSFPNDVQKLYKDSNFGKCKNESFYFDTVEIIDDKTGEHLKRINLLEKVHNVSEVFNRNFKIKIWINILGKFDEGNNNRGLGPNRISRC